MPLAFTPCVLSAPPTPALQDPTVAAKSELPTVEEAAPPAEAAPQQQVPAEQGDDIEEGEIVGELASAMAALGVAAPAAAEGSSQVC